MISDDERVVDRAALIAARVTAVKKTHGAHNVDAAIKIWSEKSGQGKLKAGGFVPRRESRAANRWPASSLI
jgi:hypothetical protein